MTSAVDHEPVMFTPDVDVEDNHARYWLHQVSTRLRREICWCWHERGLYPNESLPTEGALPPFIDKTVAVLSMNRRWKERKDFSQTDPTASYLTKQLKTQPEPENKRQIQGSFSWIVDKLNLDKTSRFVLSLGLAVPFDSATGSIVASCLNDPAKTYPNLALAQRIWDNPEQVSILAEEGHPLFRFGLLHQNERVNNTEINLENPTTVPFLVARQLLYPSTSFPQILEPISNIGGNFTINNSSKVVGTRLKTENKETLHIVPIIGPKGSNHLEAIQGISNLTNRLVVAYKGDPRLLEDARYFNSLATLCWLRNMDLFLDHNVVSTLTNDKAQFDSRLIPLQTIPVTIFLAITEQSQLASIPNNLLLPVVDIPEISYHERVQYWKKTLKIKTGKLDKVISECSRRFRYEKNTINSICEGLKEMSQISEKDFVNACMVELDLDLGELAQKVIPRFKISQLILPRRQFLQFHEIVNAMKSLTKVHYELGAAKMWNESGISVLFAGQSGTGKTMAAEVLANELNLPMYRIDLSQVVNKYIGETEKRLKRLFDAADTADTILFFDEADSLFGHRTEVKDAHDRYANLEINYLLQRMERFKGLAILATNRKKDLDEAFLRRLRHIIDFPLPGEEERKRIWLQMIPESIDVSEIDFVFLAKQFQLTGGQINSIIFNACLQSANDSHGEGKDRLTMTEVITAVKREYDKMNRSISLEQFEPYTEIVQKLE